MLSYYLNVMYLFTKAWWLLVEWKLFLMVFSLYFSLWNHGVYILSKLLANCLLVCGCIWILLKDSSFLLFLFLWLHLSRCFDFGLSNSSLKWSHIEFFIIEPWFFWSYILIKYYFHICAYMYKCEKIVVFYKIFMMNFFIKAFWLLIEGKLIKMESHYMFDIGNMILLLLHLARYCNFWLIGNL